jgi:hypothetical protein
MKRLVRLRDEADRDLTDAASWYEEQREGLGHEFLDDAQSLFDRIGEEPLNFPIVYRNARRAVMNRFPFCIYFLWRRSMSLCCQSSMELVIRIVGKVAHNDALNKDAAKKRHAC